ncbi:MAG: FKBP-type peptidyl-prolyl cis-trans isomerase, partial [Thermonemataceae bacterium]|nr:FKBP-type peptidyl-prolyl cis-trans isomerase [Thermonemataceae bacterium]
MKTSKYFIVLAISIFSFLSCKRENEDETFVAEQTERNEQEIQSYIAQKGLNMQKDENGIYYNVSGSITGSYPDSTYRYVELKYEVRVIPSETAVDTLYKLSGTKTFIAPLLNPTATSGATVIKPSGVDIFMQIGKQKIAKGQKATLLMNHTLAYGTASTPFLPPYSAIRVDLEVINVKSENDFISEKIQSMGLTVTENKDGVIFVRTATGSSDVVAKDSATVTTKYVGRRVIDNTIFDSNESFSFKPYIGVIEGWKLGIPLMKLNEKGYLFMPSNLAYGSSGSGSILPYSPLYFDIE